MASHKGQKPTGHRMETDMRGQSRDTHCDRCPPFSQKSQNLKISQEKEKHPEAASPTPAPASRPRDGLHSSNCACTIPKASLGACRSRAGQGGLVKAVPRGNNPASHKSQTGGHWRALALGWRLSLGQASPQSFLETIRHPQWCSRYPRRRQHPCPGTPHCASGRHAGRGSAGNPSQSRHLSTCAIEPSEEGRIVVRPGEEPSQAQECTASRRLGMLSGPN